MKLASSFLVATLAVAAFAACSGTGGSSTFQPGGGAAGSGSNLFDGGAADASLFDASLGDGSSAPTVTVIGPGADASAPTKFGGALDPAAGPEVVYPPDGVLVPLNMNSLELHFVPAAGQSLFEITFESPQLRYVVYTGCTPLGAGCVYTPDDAFWSSLAQAAGGKPPVAYAIRAVDGDSPGTVGVSPSRTLAFTKDSLVGGLYYWNTSGTLERFDFGYPGKAAELFLAPAEAGALVCVGCHVLSRDGKKLVVGKDMPMPATYLGIDVATKKPLDAGGQPLAGGANFFSFSPDATKLLASDGVNTWMQDVATGQVGAGLVVPGGTMPDWSADGATLVYAKPKSPPPLAVGTPGINSAGLETRAWNGSAFSNVGKSLVPSAGQNNYYPTFSPDSRWVLFNRSAADHSSYGNGSPDSNSGALPDGQLWAVAAGGGTPVALDAANAGGASSWPKWATEQMQYYGGGVMWATFSSARGYGLRLADGERSQLWMVAFDPQRAAQGLDPSYPPFWLPFQDIATGNHIAQWVAHIERQPCHTTSDCPSGQACQNGFCVPNIH